LRLPAYLFLAPASFFTVRQPLAVATAVGGIFRRAAAAAATPTASFQLHASVEHAM